MKKFLALAAVMLGLASCQTEPEGFDVNVGGEQDVNITVSLPEGTRADSALGAFAHVDFTKYDVRFQCEVHYNDQVKVLPVQISDNGTTATFPVRLIANRDYKFVVWADLVKEDTTADLHYITSGGLANISINDWAPMDETRDAFTCSEVRRFERNTDITLTLKRPFAKLRVITTDMKELMGVVPAKAEVVYTTPYRETFNAVDGKAGDAQYKKTHNLFDIASYGETGTDKTLFADYLFVGENDIVNFSMNVYDKDGVVIDEQKNFNTPIPVKRNYVTTIKGNILTYADDFNVTIEDGFDNAGNIEDIPYYYAAVTNGADLLKAISEGRKIIALNNITVTAADANFEEGTTRAGEQPINAVINLNGFTITIENNGTDALVDLNGGVLTVEGEGAIESTAGALVEGTTVVTGGAEVEAEVAVDENGQSTVKSGREALVYICENGGEFTFTENLEATDVIFIETTKPIVINGNNKTITSSASRVFRIIAKANVTINNLNIVSTTAKGNYDSVRGISMDGAIDGIVLTLNNCSVDFTADTAHDYSYAINKVGETSKNVQITINGGTYEGANVVNIWGDENIITINGATLNNLYRANEYYCGCCIRLEGSGNIVNIDNATFTGAHAVVVNEKTPGANTVNYGENINTENLKRYCIKAGSELYYTLKDAVSATTEGEIKVLANTEMTEKVTVAKGKNITLDLNGRTISGKTSGTTNPQDLFLVNGNLTIKDGTITAEHVGANMGWNGQGTIFNITAGGVVTLNGVTAKHLGGTDMNFVAHLNNWGTASFNVENSILEATYIAVRVFNSGPDMNNVSIKNTTLKGKYCFWVHNYNAAGDNCGTDATLNFDIFNGTNTFEYTSKAPVLYGFNNPIYFDADGEAYGNAAKIGDVEYETLDAAVAAAKAGDTITLIKNVTLKKAIAIENVEVIFDLNGKTVKAPASSAFEAKTGAVVTIKNGKVVAYESTVRAIGGKAIIESGEYTSTGTALDTPATYRYSLDCREGGELIINGGTFKSNNGMINVSSTVTINGGKFENVVEKAMTRHFAYVSAPLTINDGEFYGKANSAAGGCFFCGAAEGGDIQVNGGKFTSLWISGSVNRIFEVYYGGTINVTGGMFNTNGGIASFVTENTDEATKAAYPYVAK